MSAPTYFGSASNPADNGSANEPITLDVTPPASMVSGDLVILIAQADSGTPTQNNLGGQTWHTDLGVNATCTFWWCQFNGTWSANPSVDFPSVGGTHATTVVMHVFRPSSASVTWQTTTGGGNGAHTTSVSIPGGTPGLNDNVSLIVMFAAAANTYGSIGGSGWVVTGSAQYRNTAGADQVVSFAHNLQGTAAAKATMTETASGNGSYSRLVLAAVAASETITADKWHPLINQPIFELDKVVSYFRNLLNKLFPFTWQSLLMPQLKPQYKQEPQ